MSNKARYASVILDVDSTLCGVEGIDWLAQRRGKEVADQSITLTERAMNGEIALEAVYGERLALVRPSTQDVAALGEEYLRTLAPGASATVSALQSAGVTVILISGGIRRAIEPVAKRIGLTRDELHAVDLYWDAGGTYLDFDRQSPLTRQRGKLEMVRSLQLRSPKLAVGDGATDAVMREAADAFALYTGFVRRKQLIPGPDAELHDYDELLKFVLSG